MKKKICPHCQKSFICKEDEAHCWCAKLPMVIEVPDNNSQEECLCQDCLKKMIAQRIKTREKEGKKKGR